MALTAGTQISHYRIVSRIGVGGMGEVYKADDTVLDRPVALKILPADLVDNEDRVRRFVQEAKSASALNHPHIVTIYEIGKIELERADDSQPDLAAGNGSNGASHRGLFHYIAMEYIDGDTLRDKIHRDRTDLKKLLEYFAQVADGLAKAHTSGIVHRDLKPENVMITHDGYAKILDFGLAKLLEPQKPASAGDMQEAETMMMGRTQPGIVMGTIGYMSPEQVQGKVVDQRSDIFSFGCILYEATTGHKPFHGESVIDSLHKIVYSQAPPIREFNPETPAELQRIIRKCLSKDPDERYQSIKDANIDLRELVREYDSQPSVSAFYSTMTSNYPRTASNSDISMASGSIHPPARPAARRTPGLWIAIGVAGALVLGVVITLLIQRVLNTRTNTEASEPFEKMRVTRLTNTGKSGQAAISPDGKYVVHVMIDGGQQSLWVRQVAASSNVQIVPSAEAMYSGVTFSRDGNYIYYVRQEKTSSMAMLYQVPVLGGTPRKIIEDVDSPVSFSPDGSQFVFVRHVASQVENSLIIANADGGEERKLATRKSPNFFRGPSWSPSGKVIACAALLNNGTQMNVVEVKVEDGSERNISLDTWPFVGRVTWLADASGLVMIAKEQTSSLGQIWHLAYADGRARRITNDLNNYGGVSLTADSNGLVTVQSDRIANLWVAPNGNYDNARQITSGAGKYANLAWTPDGRIVYGTVSTGSIDIWIMDADGSNQKQLTVDSGVNTSPAVSPDGRYIVFSSNRANSATISNIWRMNIDGSNAKQLTNGGGERMPIFSPDGKWVVYTSLASGKSLLWKVSIDGGEPVQLTDKMSGAGAVSPDGKHIACYYWDEQLSTQMSMVIIPFEGGQPVKSLNMPPTLVHWMADGTALTYLDERGGVANIWSQPIAGGPPRQITNFKSDLIFDFDWSRTKQLACSRGVVTSDVVLLNNIK